MSNYAYKSLSGALQEYKNAVEATGSGDSLRWMDQESLKSSYNEFKEAKGDKPLTDEEAVLVKEVKYQLG